MQDMKTDTSISLCAAGRFVLAKFEDVAINVLIITPAKYFQRCYIFESFRPPHMHVCDRRLRLCCSETCETDLCVNAEVLDAHTLHAAESFCGLHKSTSYSCTIDRP